MSKGVYKLNFDCGRMGRLQGVFVSTKEMVGKLIESKIEVYFGEALGKHSEVYGNIENHEIIFITDSKEVVEVVENYKLSSGFNPFDYNSINFEREGLDTDDMTVGEIISELLLSENAVNQKDN